MLPGLLVDHIDDDLLGALGREFPAADEFHSDLDPKRNARFRDEFGGITPFPCSSSTLNLLAVHERLSALAAELLGTDDLRAYSIEFWAKYSGAADYEQAFHRDYLNHSVVVPDADAPASQIEMLIYLSNVDDDLGPIALLPRRHAPDMPALPNWYPATDDNHDRQQPHWTSPVGRPDWYDREHRAVGPAGTVIAYRLDTFHAAPTSNALAALASLSIPTSVGPTTTGSGDAHGPTSQPPSDRGCSSSSTPRPSSSSCSGSRHRATRTGTPPRVAALVSATPAFGRSDGRRGHTPLRRRPWF